MRVHQCPVCQATYSSASHLRRHEAIHGGQRRFACHFCSQKFFRVDVARRHSQSCPSKGDSPLPDPKPRGKRRHACNSCALSKRACDQQRPCEACRTNGLICAYDRLRSFDVSSSSSVQGQPPTQIPEDLPHPGSFSESSSAGAGAVTETSDTSRPKAGKIPIDWLLNFTDPNSKTIGGLFGTDPEEPPVAEVDVPPPAEITALSPDFRGYLDELMQPHIEQSFSERWWGLSPGLECEPTLTIEPQNPALHARLQELKAHLAAAQSRLTEEETQPNMEQLDVLFNVSNVGAFVRCYFDNWHPNCPILHRPSFDPDKVSLPLLLGVFLIGAQYSSPRDTAAIAFKFYDLAEQYVFEHEDFKQMLMLKRGDPTDNISLEPLYASFMIVIMQTWGGSIKSRRRIRTSGYSDIVSVARLMSVTSARNSFFIRDKPNTSPFDWNMFTEEESRVRLACYLWLFDTHYSIFLHHPPRFMMAEMSGHQPCREDVFAATDSSTCYLLALEERRSRPPSLFSCTEMLMQDTLEPTHYTQFGTLTTLNLFSISAGLCTMVFLAKANCFCPYMMPRIQIALRRWKALWDDHLPRVDKKGFMKNANEFSLLANILVTAEASGAAAKDSSEKFDMDSMEELNAMLQQLNM